MSEPADVPLSKVDSAVQGLDQPSSPKQTGRRRASSSAAGVWNINDLEAAGQELVLPIETQRTGWKINTSPSSIEDQVILKMMLTDPPVKRIDLRLVSGLEVIARNLKGVTIKDAMDAIHKPNKKKADDEFTDPYLAGFEWDKGESWTRLKVHLVPTPKSSSHAPMTKKSKKEKKKEEVAIAEAVGA